MASLRAAAWKAAAASTACLRPLRTARSFTSAAVSYRKADTPPTPEELEKNPFFDKYREKLQKALLQKAANPPAAAPAATPAAAAQQTKQPAAPATAPAAEPSSASRPNKAKLSQARGSSQVAPLSNILNLDLVKDLPAAEVEKIWLEYHKSKDCISAVLPADVFDRLDERWRENPLFVYAIPREGGFEFVFAQANSPTAQYAFTPLIEYKTHQENARSVLMLSHYTELKESKGIVLMKGEVDLDRISMADATFLANQLKTYYLGPEECLQDVIRFNKHPANFDHNSVLQRLTTLK